MAEPTPTDIPYLAPEEAVRLFVKKGLALSFDWKDVWKAEHGRAFTIAKMLNVSLLEDAQAILLKGLADGESNQQIAKALKARMQEAGWWGKQVQTDPLTGEKQLVQLGSDARIRTIINTNMRTAYAQGRWERIQRTKKALPVDHPWWGTHYPPCDWGCRCTAINMTKGQAARRDMDVGAVPPANPPRTWVNKRTGEVSTIERGIGAGWDYHVGRSPLDGIAPTPLKGFGLDEAQSLASAHSEGSKSFLRLFKADDDGVVRDVAGWPLPISARWLSGLDGEAIVEAWDAGRALTNPDEIRLVWVKDKSDRFVLVRRYSRSDGAGATVCDLAGQFWRWRRANRIPQSLRGGVTVWRREKAG
jgi:hypothetical protein